MLMYRETLTTTATMHADSSKEAEAKLELAKLEAKARSEEKRARAANDEAEKRLREELRQQCAGADCEALLKTAAFDASTRLLKLKKADIKYTAPNASFGHVLEAQGGKAAKLTLSDTAWVVVLIGEVLVMARK